MSRLQNQNEVINELFEALQAGIFGEINFTVYPLADAAQAHEDMESRKTTGSVIFHP